MLGFQVKPPRLGFVLLEIVYLSSPSVLNKGSSCILIIGMSVLHHAQLATTFCFSVCSGFVVVVFFFLRPSLSV